MNDPEPDLNQRIAFLIDSLFGWYAAFHKLRIRVIAWFVRISWPVSLIWGGVDLYRLWTQPPPLEQLDQAQGEAAIRIGAGVLLFLFWFFGIRTWGHFTANKDGVLER